MFKKKEGEYGKELIMIHKGLMAASALAIVALCFSAHFASANLSDWISHIRPRITGHATSQSVSVNVSIGNNAPNITFVTITSSYNPTENSFNAIVVNFTAWDLDGIANLDSKGGKANFTKTNEAVRGNTTCIQVNTFATYYANYSCIIPMWYFDASGTWNITALVNDSSGTSAVNTTSTFTWNQLSAFVSTPASLTWGSLSPGQSNQTSNNDPLTLNNTGNKNITTNSIQINATNLRGETDTSKAIWAGNITVSLVTGSNIECNIDTNQSAVMTAGLFVNITNSSLSVGNHSAGSAGIRNFYACMRTIGSELSSQAYSTTNEGSWTIKIT